jgi:NAD(P)H-hydrate epimerase
VKLVDSESMAAIDRRSQEEFGIPSIVLMENAGQRAVDAVRRASPAFRALFAGTKSRGVVFIAGKGNNGGDALVMARRCRCDGVEGVSVVLAGGRPEEGSDPGRNLRMCETLGIPVVDFTERERDARALVSGAEWVMDGMSGTGLRGTLREPLAAMTEAVNSGKAFTIAIDVPSGVGDGFRPGFPAVRADMTLAMGLPKRCLYLPHARRLCGRIIVVPVGFPPAVLEDEAIAGELLEESAFRRLMPRIPEDTHKNARGHVAVFAGSPGTTGAAWLSATAAARARSGMVTAFLDEGTYPILAPKFSSVMAKPWDGPEASGGLGFEPGRFGALLIGPGWGTHGERLSWMESLLSAGIPGVIDADGLTLLGMMAGKRGFGLGGRWVLTPHPGEFSRLSEEPKEEVQNDPVLHSLALSRRLDAIVVLKGACTCIADPSGRYWIYDGMNPALATGGSGDVLAGIIAAGIAGGLKPLDAALFGVSLHGRVGRAAAGWFLAEDLLPFISTVLGEEG